MPADQWGRFVVSRRARGARIGVESEHDGPQRAAALSIVDPSLGQIGERGEFLVACESLGLEPPHLAGRGHIALDGFVADDPAHRGGASQPISVVDVFISGKPVAERPDP